jgi:hypothetical protein
MQRLEMEVFCDFYCSRKKMNETFLYYIYRRPKIKWQQSGILYRVILKVARIF